MTGRDRRAVLVGGIIVLLAVLVLRVGPWALRAHQELRDGTASRAALLARARTELSLAPTLDDSAAAVRREMLALAPRILTGDTEAAAAADLVGRLDGLAAEHLVRLDRTDPLPDSTRAGHLRRLSVRVALAGDSRGVTALLQSLDRDPVAFQVAELRLLATDPHAADQVPEMLTGEATLRAWYLLQESE